MHDTERKPRATIISDDEFRRVWTSSRSIQEVTQRTGYSRDSAVRRAGRIGLPAFHTVSRAVSYQIASERWERSAARCDISDQAERMANYAAGIVDACGKFDTIRSASGILGHRLTVTVVKSAGQALAELSQVYGGDVAAPLIGPGVRSATSVAWVIETSELYVLAKVAMNATRRWKDEFYAVCLFYQNSERN